MLAFYDKQVDLWKKRSQALVREMDFTEKADVRGDIEYVKKEEK